MQRSDLHRNLPVAKKRFWMLVHMVPWKRYLKADYLKGTQGHVWRDRSLIPRFTSTLLFSLVCLLSLAILFLLLLLLLLFCHPLSFYALIPLPLILLLLDANGPHTFVSIYATNKAYETQALAPP